jgi:hypothetical protein
MSNGSSPLASRRARLIEMAAAQRLRFAADVEPWRRPLAIVDRGIAAARFIRGHPAWLLGAGVALRAAGLGPSFRQGFAAWLILRRLGLKRGTAPMRSRRLATLDE